MLVRGIAEPIGHAGGDSHVLPRRRDDPAAGHGERSGPGQHLERLVLVQVAVRWDKRARGASGLNYQLPTAGIPRRAKEGDRLADLRALERQSSSGHRYRLRIGTAVTIPMITRSRRSLTTCSTSLADGSHGYGHNAAVETP